MPRPHWAPRDTDVFPTTPQAAPHTSAGTSPALLRPDFHTIWTNKSNPRPSKTTENAAFIQPLPHNPHAASTPISNSNANSTPDPELDLELDSDLEFDLDLKLHLDTLGDTLSQNVSTAPAAVA